MKFHQFHHKSPLQLPSHARNTMRVEPLLSILARHRRKLLRPRQASPWFVRCGPEDPVAMGPEHCDTTRLMRPSLGTARFQEKKGVDVLGLALTRILADFLKQERMCWWVERGVLHVPDANLDRGADPPGE
ncbi:hypothetical protein NUU61_000198 [Penicillium alfredii]|uniref:Uncharacterized protein n=1 Tax=Penicillium alfredii TaxID=1506179 RepID=A0A9W9G9I6_9EURO|nr:uncharacterized protein NUU61_000198 [Penicillium alfredii]KAJ5114439.1 hypothetical protein NUU61_000198 [Penicillium alfredii]